MYYIYLFYNYSLYKEKIIYIYIIHNTCNKYNKIHERSDEKELTRDRDKGSYTSTFDPIPPFYIFFVFARRTRCFPH